MSIEGSVADFFQIVHLLPGPQDADQAKVGNMHDDTRRNFLLPPITGLGDVLNWDVWPVMEMKHPLE